MAAMAGLASIMQNLKMPIGIDPVPVNLPVPPRLEGPLARNAWLTKVQRRADGKIMGPESMVVVKGHIYTGLSDGYVVRITPEGAVKKIRQMSINTCGHIDASEDACGRPLGMRVDKFSNLVVADAFSGIVRLNTRTNQVERLVEARTLKVNNRSLGYVNDLAIADDGTIFFTSSSSKHSYLKDNNILFEGENTGRVLFWNPLTKQVQELVTDIMYPNGIELSADGTYLLIGEATRSRILKAWIGRNHPKRGTLEVFADNLPGVVDNIRRNPRGSFWVGLSQTRSEKMPSVLDTYGNNTKVRGALIAMVNRNVKFDNPKYGIAVELDDTGKIVRSLQDPNGKLYTAVSQVTEEDGMLYVASPEAKWVGVLNLQVIEASKTGDFTGGLGDHPVVEKFLTTVRKNMETMPLEKVRQAVLELTKELVFSRRQSMHLYRLTAAKHREVQGLKRVIETLVKASTTPAGIAGIAGQNTTAAGMPGDLGTGTSPAASPATSTHPAQAATTNTSGNTSGTTSGNTSGQAAQTQTGSTSGAQETTTQAAAPAATTSEAPWTEFAGLEGR